MKSKVLRVGFDLDGVILYNPVRIVRPLISIVKRLLLHKKGLKFYYPHSPVEKWAWKQFHRSSIFIAPGLNELRQLVYSKKVKACIVTGRYSFMGPELMRWIKKNRLDSVFSEIYFNSKDEQPHLFKKRMIQKLDLDIFVEDNWDIVHFLSKQVVKSQIYWIYNIFDRKLPYEHKFPILLHAVKKIEETI